MATLAVRSELSLIFLTISATGLTNVGTYLTAFARAIIMGIAT